MRRRCFFILILVLTLLAFIDALGIPLKPAQLPPGESEAITCTGKILRIQSKDGRTDIQIKLLTYGDKKVDFSENVLVSVYENLNACSLSRSIISFRAVLRDAPEAGNPHCFNSKAKESAKSQRYGHSKLCERNLPRQICTKEQFTGQGVSSCKVFPPMQGA